MKRNRIVAICALCVCLLCAMLLVACDSQETPGENSKKTYTVTFYDEKGAVIESKSVEEGTVPACTYKVTDTEEWDYTLDGWSTSAEGEVLSALPAATADAKYYAKVSAQKQKVTVTFVSNGGSAVSALSVDYGTVAQAPSAPTYSGYRFVGWCTDAALQNAVNWTTPITANVTYYAKWNVKVDLGNYLSALLSGYKMDPYHFVPTTMRPAYAANLISSAPSNYDSSVSVSAIPAYGFGEQWNMILENLEQSETFFNVLNVVDTLASTSVVVFNNYLDSNVSDTAHYAFTESGYNVVIDFDGEVLYYVLEYTANVPALGQQTAQIALAMDIESGEKTVRVQLGDANALRYVISEDAYEFAIKYAGVRRAYISIAEDEDGAVTGHIYEFLEYAGVGTSSAADFYVVDGYAFAVGNKASGMLITTNYIVEAYNTATGKLIAYEVMEKKSRVTFNTYWFDLARVQGLQSIRYDSTNEVFYINGLSTAWEAKKVGGFIVTNPKAESRRFDIEFRTQYFYTYDESTGTYQKIAVEVPMLFIQEEHYEDFEEDVEDANGVALSVEISANELTVVSAVYDAFVPVFEQSKEAVSAQDIVDYIGNKITF